MSEWRPIEAAPRDGTAIAVLTEGGRLVKAAWDYAGDTCDGEPACAWIAVDEDEHPRCWTDGVCWTLNEDDEPSDPPAHWMPLPAPPTPEKKEGEDGY